MKKNFLAGLLLPWLCFAFAQGQTLPQKLQYLYGPLDKSQVETNYLMNIAVPLVNPTVYDGSLNDSNHTDINTFGMLYGEFRQGWVGTGNGLPAPSIYLSKIKQLQYGDALPLAILAMQYNQIIPDALESNLLSYDGAQVHDVPGRLQSPYLRDTMVAIAALADKVKELEPVFCLPSDLWFSNLGSNNVVISLDLDDGQGWQAILPGQEIRAQYSNTGTKEIKVRLEYDGFFLYGHTRLIVDEIAAEDRSGGMEWPRSLYEAIAVSATKPYLGGYGNATMHIFYNNSDCNGVKRLIRPLIIVEGYEEAGFAEATYERMFSMLEEMTLNGGTESLTDFLYPAKYDLIYIDLADGSDWIQRNAFVVEEVIRQVNTMKAATGSTEENVLIGVSMGGICSKYALLDMQNTLGEDHDCRLFITYDAPLRGANIPIGVQCMAQFASENFGDAIPLINTITNAFAAPTPRQLLLYHVNDINGSAEPINPTQVAFLAELDGLGSLGIRHVAISNGATDGTFIENEIAPGDLLFDLNATNEEASGLGLLTVGVALRATGDYTNTQIMTANATIHVGGPIVIGVSEVVNCYTKPYDVSPGGNSNIGIAALSLDPSQGALGAGLVDAGFTIEEASHLYMRHHCFEPTFSSVSTFEPGTMRSSVSCGTPARCSNPSVPVVSRYTGESEINQEHVFLDGRIGLLLVDELVTMSPPPLGHPFDMTSNLNTYFNVGLSIYSPIPTITVATGNGKLSINNSGKVAYGTSGDPNSPHNMLVADTQCDAVITVESGGKLTIGSDLSQKHGVLSVNHGATVHIKSGGTLHITSEQSKLLIKPGAQLILDPGAIVRLESPGAAVRIEGDLVLNGDIDFRGLGYFDFASGNQLVFGPGVSLFKLTGAGKGTRMVRLSADLEIEPGHGVDWKRGALDATPGGKLLIKAAGICQMDQMTVNGNASSDIILAQQAARLTVSNTDFTTARYFVNSQNSGIHYFHLCTMNQMEKGMVVAGGNGAFTISECTFGTYSVTGVEMADRANLNGFYSTWQGQAGAMGMDLTNVQQALLRGCSLGGHNGAPAGPFDPLDLYSYDAAIRLDQVPFLILRESGVYNNAIGILSDGLIFAPSNIFLLQGTYVAQNQTGVYMNGTETEGLVLMDCAKMLNNETGIKGNDITLMLDAVNAQQHPLDGDEPNVFLREGSHANGDLYIDVCYNSKDPIPSIPMRRNWWAVNSIQTRQLMPNDFIKLLKGCNVNEPAQTLPELTAQPSWCNNQEFAAASFPGQGADAACSVSLSAGTPPSDLSEIWHTAYQHLRNESFENALTGFQPLADLWQPDLSQFSPNCQLYIQTARAIVGGGGLPRPNNDRTTTSAAQLVVVPNPADESVTLFLEEGEHEIRIYDAYGRFQSQLKATGKTPLPTGVWMPGLYLLEVYTPDGKRLNSKLIVNH